MTTIQPQSTIGADTPVLTSGHAVYDHSPASTASPASADFPSLHRQSPGKDAHRYAIGSIQRYEQQLYAKLALQDELACELSERCKLPQQDIDTAVFSRTGPDSASLSYHPDGQADAVQLTLHQPSEIMDELAKQFSEYAASMEHIKATRSALAMMGSLSDWRSPDMSEPASTDSSEMDAEELIGAALHRTSATNTTQQVGNKKTLSREKRGLTPGEGDIVQTLFKNTIDLSKLTIHHHILTTLIPKLTSLSLHNRLYFGKKTYCADFSQGTPDQLHLFVTQLAHIWQHALKYDVVGHSATHSGSPHDYTLHPDSTLSDFTMNTQALIIADYYSLKYQNLCPPGEGAKKAARANTYEEGVLQAFLENPSNPALLPAK